MRNELLTDVHKTIERSTRFVPTDFSVDYEEKTGSALLSINSSISDGHWLMARLPMRKKSIEGQYSSVHVIDVTMRPGELGSQEEVTCYGKSQLLQSIASWLSYLDSELSASLESRRIEEQKKRVDELEKQFADLPDRYATAEEATALRAKLIELEAAFGDSIAKSQKDKDEAKKLIDQLHAEFMALAIQVETIKARRWGRALIARMLHWTSQPANQQLLKDGMAAVRGLLPNGDSGSSSAGS